MPNQTFYHTLVIEASDKRPASMKVKTALVCAFTITMVFLVVESSCAPKSKFTARNWGPQSMLYLKGRYGRRYASDNEEQCYKIDLDSLNAVLKRYKSSAPMKFLNIRRKLRAQNMDTDYLD
ncbi:spexin prohormone 1-like [Rhineura floridana]|uniref:spexin prohormone 1-like n=1 Tax=Rhineura floridana TaxID=261503 RepID=UPI002AC81EAF|nr:spexin prohormone 1-like [Rhineura floridana]